MPRELSTAELIDLATSGGVKMTREDKPQEIAGFRELLDKLGALLMANEARTAADNARSKVLSDALETIRKQLDTPPATPEVIRPRPGYEFKVERSRAGFIEKIVATPK